MNRPSFRLASRLPALAVAALIAGCASEVPAPTLLSLPSAPAETTGAPVPLDAALPVLVVRRVGVPEYLSARRVRFRSDVSTLAEWPHTFWAERMEIGLSREYTAALRRGLPGWVVCEGSCPDRQPSLSVTLEFGALDYLRPAKEVQARARVVVGTGGAQAQVRGAFDQAYALPVAADTAQGQAETYAEVLRKVAEASIPVIMRARQ